MAFKSSKHVALAAIGMAAALGAAWWFQKPAPPRPPGSAAARAEAGRSAPVTVQAQAARQMTLRDEAQAVGSLRPRHAAQFPRWPAGAARAVAGAVRRPTAARADPAKPGRAVDRPGQPPPQ